MEKVLTFNQIDELAKKLANYVEENTVIALIGELGTGKTTFTKIFAKEFHYIILMCIDYVIQKKFTR